MSAATKLDEALMNKDFINAFIQSVKNAHKITANVDLTPGKPSVLSHAEKHGEITGFVGIVSQNKRWILSISYTKEAALQVYKSLFGEDKTSLDKDVCDLIGELTNQIYGGGKNILNQRGFAFEMALPTVIAGEFRTHFHDAGTTLAVPFDLNSSAACVFLDIIAGKV